MMLQTIYNLLRVTRLNLSKSQVTGLSVVLFAFVFAVSDHILSFKTIDEVAYNDSETADIAASLESGAELLRFFEDKTSSEGLALGEAPSLPIMQARAESELGPQEKTLTIKKGDTIASMLCSLGINRTEVHLAIQSLRRSVNFNNLKVGQEIVVRYHANEDGEYELQELEMTPSSEHAVYLSRSDEGTFNVEKQTVELKKVVRHASGPISVSFYNAALRQGVPARLVKEAVNCLSHEVNWQHDAHEGDKFALSYEVFEDQNGNAVRYGDLKFAAFAPGDKVHKIYHYKPKNGPAGYFNEQGISIVKAFLSTPIDPSKMRVSSPFSHSRRHPILKYSRRHTGVDYAAPKGTAVKAACGGRVIFAGYRGGYGKLVILQHDAKHQTYYAHLNRIHVSKGQGVKQSQRIGDVGRTGTATGDHLHYEVRINGKPVNPQKVTSTLPARRLAGGDLSHFVQVKYEIDRVMPLISESASTLIKPISAKIVRDED